MAVERAQPVPDKAVLPFSPELPLPQRETQSKRLFFYIGGICSKDQEIQRLLRSTPLPLGFPLRFSFDQNFPQKSNYEVHAKLEDEIVDGKRRRKLTTGTRFSLSGPLTELEGREVDNGPFIEEKAVICPGESKFEYSWIISDGSVKPVHLLNSQEAVDKILSLGVMLGNFILRTSKK